MEKEVGLAKRVYQAYRKVLLKRHAVWLMLSVMLIFALVFSSGSAFAYNWDFSTPSDYTYNATEVIVANGTAYLNSSGIAPYSWWHLNENTGTIINDSSGNNRNGTAIGSITAPDWAIGKLNSALLFNGTQAINFTKIANFNRNEVFSYELWFKTNSSSAVTLMGKEDITNVRGVDLYLSGGKISVGFYTSGTNYFQRVTTPAYNDGNWHHLIMTYDGTSLVAGVKIYVDGSQPATTTPRSDVLSGNLTNNETFYIGSRKGYNQGYTGLIDEALIYNRILSQTDVTFRYNSGIGTENSLPSYPIRYYNISAINNFTFISKLTNFSETATTIGSSIRYIVSDDGTNFKFWNSSVWDNSNGSWGQSSPASDINSYISTLGSLSGNFSFKAVLHSNAGTYTPYLDNIEVLECSENWIENYTNCGTNLNTSCSGYDNKTKLYYDSNSCGSINNLPADNGTCSSCNYCSPSWFCGSLADCSNFWKLCNYVHGENATNYGTCCDITGYSSDCNFTGDLSQYRQICGNMVTYFTTNADYPYVNCNTTATFGLAITINNTRQDFEHLFMEFPTIPYTFNWTWNNATQSYSINLLFTTEGDYPYVIWSDFPYGVMQNITGTLEVRCPCYITVNGYTLFPTNATEPYKNTHAYIGMELTSQKKTGMTGSRNPYDTQLEDFLTPLTFSHYPYKMFHAPYVNGQAVVKLWEKNETYAIRLFDGDVTFQQGVYSTVNATRLYKTNIFLGTQKFTCGTGGDEQFNYFFTKKELQPFTWLFNWIFLILIIAVIVIAGFLLFMSPMIAMPFGIGGLILLCILRIVLWIAIG